ncbi:MAG: hypothetical protein JWO95_3195 [Verrucomicrobiales bacterium]|nr:hypothetical protein [Verrucomicrobiales bacterium]
MRARLITFVFGFLFLTLGMRVFAQPDYPTAHWVPPACTKYYNSGNGHKFCVIHDMEGYYEFSISYLDRCDTNPTNGNYNVAASINYCVNGLQNGTDTKGHTEGIDDAPQGDITQSVLESKYAWHALCLNTWAFGTEHEGFVSNPSWYTEEMYVASAALQKWLCNRQSIPKDRNHIVGHNEWQNPTWTNWLATNYPSIDPSCNNHTDPGIYWDWTHFMKLITGEPAITTQPYSQLVDAGTNATFRATVQGSNTLTFQWYKNGAAIAGATATSYTIVNAQTASEGSYTLVASNSLGTITSQIATLKVSPAWVLSFFDTFETNSASRWNLFTSSTDYTTNWALDYSTQSYVTNGVTASIPPAPSGTGTHGLKVTCNKNDATAAAVGLSLYPKSLTFSGDYILRFDAWINYGGGPGGTNGSTEFATCGLNHANTRVNWSGATASDGLFFAWAGDGATGGDDYRAYQGAGAAAPSLSSFASSGMAASGATRDHYSDPFFQSLFDSPAYETQGACGKHWIQCELAYINKNIYFQINGRLVATRTNTTTYTSGAPMIGYMDAFASISSVPQDNYGIFDNVRVFVAATAPVITSQPANQTVLAGNNVPFTVFAGGTAPLSYQWRLNNVNIGGATSSTYTRANVQSGDAGSYTVFISNGSGSTTSSNAVLVVLTPPSITAQPQSQTVTAGNTATFTVSASGDALLRYQWRKNGSSIGGATSTSYTLNNVSSADIASYSVVVTNNVGTATSGNATLTVNAAPSIQTQPQSQSAANGGTATFSVTALGTAPLGYQWRFLGSDISGATSSAYTISNAQNTNIGYYSVVVTNPYGTVTSSTANFTISGWFFDPLDANTLANYNTNSSSATDNRYGFAFDYSTVGVPQLPGSSSTRALKLEANLSAVQIASISFSPKNQNFTGDYQLRFNVWLNCNGPEPTGGAGSTEAFIAGVGTTGDRVEWAQAGNNANGVWVLANTDGGAATTSAYPDYAMFTNVTSGASATLVKTNSGIYAAPNNANPATAHANTYYTSAFPSKTVPAAQTALAPATQTGTANTGSIGFAWHEIIVKKTNNLVTWSIDGLRIATVTNPIISGNNVFIGYMDPFSTVATTNYQFGLFANLRVEPASAETGAAVPAITSQPQSTTANFGANATITVSASSSSALRYQWQKNGTSIANATSSSLTLTGVTSSDAASYHVIVMNDFDFVTSTDATLTVIDPIITQQPQTQTVSLGSSPVFSLTANGTAPLTYQWRFNGTAISGATTSTYTRNSVTASDAGSYSVIVSNSVGLITSANASLTVTISPMRLLSVMSNANQTVSMQWTADPGNTYAFQYKNTLLDAQWTTLSNCLAAGTTITTTDSLSDTQRVYRIFAAQQSSEFAGYNQLALLGNSDTFVSVPYTRAGILTETVSSVAANVVTANGSPNWIPNQFVYSAGVQSNSYFVRFTSGAAAGKIYSITANSANSVTLNLGTDSLSAVSTADIFTIESYWTPATLFPNGAGIFASPTPGNRYTEVLLPDTTTAGINLSANKVLYFNAGLWKQVGQGSTSHNDDVLSPNSFFIVRHNVATNSTLCTLGSVVAASIAVQLQASPSTPQDNYVALARPVPVSLNDSGLIASGAFVTSPLPGNRTDELQVFDNTVVQKNKSSSAIYYYWSNAWRRVGAGTTDVGADQVFTPGAGMVIRKATNNATTTWINSPTW